MEPHREYSTPLQHALSLSKAEEASRLLLDNGADFQCLNADSQTPFHSFPGQFSISFMTKVENFIDFLTPDCYGMTIMHYLAWSSQTTVETFGRCYRRCHLPMSAVGKNGRTILHFAAERGNNQLVEYILQNSTPDLVHARDDTGGTALHSAVLSKRASETIPILVSHGADVWAKDKNNHSALHRAGKMRKIIAVEALSLLLVAPKHFSVEDVLIRASGKPIIDCGSYDMFGPCIDEKRGQSGSHESDAGFSTQAFIDSFSSSGDHPGRNTRNAPHMSSQKPKDWPSLKRSLDRWKNLRHIPWCGRVTILALVLFIISFSVLFIEAGR